MVNEHTFLQLRSSEFTAGSRIMSTEELYNHLQSLSLEHGISGRESRVAALYAEAIAPLCDEVRTDALGNVVAVKYGEQEDSDDRIRFMVAAHTDEIGMVVSDIHPDGFLHVSPVGGVDRALLFAKEVWVHTSQGPLPGLLTTRPPHLTTEKERATLPPWHEIFVDIGMPKPGVEATVQVGDMITMRARCQRLAGTRVAGKAFDDRASVVSMIAMLNQLQRLRHAVDVYAVATVQEEVGLRGAITATFGVAPHVGIAVDVGFARQPGVSQRDSAKQGGGPVIAQGANIHPEVYETLSSTAKSAGIKHQFEVVPANTGTDAWAMQVTRGGIATGLLSIPLAYMHSTVETVDLLDISETGRLLAEYASQSDIARIRGWQRVSI